MGEVLQSPDVGRRAHVHQRDHDVPPPRIPLVQIPDGVQHRVPGGELVVDQNQRPIPGQQGRILRQQEMGRGVRVGLLEAPRRGDPGDRAAGGVQIRRVPDAVGDGMPQPRRRLRVTEDDRPCDLLRAQQVPYPPTQREPGPVHHGRRLRHMLAEDVGDQQMRPLGIAPQGQPQHLRELVVAHELDSEPLGDPAP